MMGTSISILWEAIAVSGSGEVSHFSYAGSYSFSLSITLVYIIILVFKIEYLTKGTSILEKTTLWFCSQRKMDCVLFCFSWSNLVGFFGIWAFHIFLSAQWWDIFPELCLPKATNTVTLTPQPFSFSLPTLFLPEPCDLSYSQWPSGCTSLAPREAARTIPKLPLTLPQSRPRQQPLPKAGLKDMKSWQPRLYLFNEETVHLRNQFNSIIHLSQI